MDKNVELQLRLNIALAMKDLGKDKWQETFDWVTGPKSTILPVAKIVEIKQG